MNLTFWSHPPHHLNLTTLIITAPFHTSAIRHMLLITMLPTLFCLLGDPGSLALTSFSLFSFFFFLSLSSLTPLAYEQCLNPILGKLKRALFSTPNTLFRTEHSLSLILWVHLPSYSSSLNMSFFPHFWFLILLLLSQGKVNLCC